jgi:hypothetical protein
MMMHARLFPSYDIFSCEERQRVKLGWLRVSCLGEEADDTVSTFRVGVGQAIEHDCKAGSEVVFSATANTYSGRYQSRAFCGQ